MGLYINAADVTVRRLSIWAFGSSFDPANNNNANIQIGNVTGAVIEENVLGTPPDSFADPVANRTLGPNIRSIGGDSGTIRNNLIGFSRSVGIYLSTNANNWLIEGNEIRGNAIGNGTLDGIDLPEGSIGTTIRANLITANLGAGVDMYRGGGQHPGLAAELYQVRPVDPAREAVAAFRGDGYPARPAFGQGPAGLESRLLELLGDSVFRVWPVAVDMKETDIAKHRYSLVRRGGGVSALNGRLSNRPDNRDRGSRLYLTGPPE
jgi:hypothetical protein